MYTLYHNPRCSKSRGALEILEKQAAGKFTIKEYLQEGLSIQELRTLFAKLKLSPIEGMRKKEKILVEENISLDGLNEDKLINLIHQHPILLERPILASEEAAVIGRPTENIQNFVN